MEKSNHKKSKYWSEIECLKCGYKGKPKDNHPNLGLRPIIFVPSLIAYEILLVIYLIKYFPAHYSCPVCKDPRRNRHNIKYIYK